MSLIKRLPANHDGRDFVVGDIHGHYEYVTRFMEYINFDTTKDRLISVGDLVDRGPENEKCLDLLYESWFFAVSGNHEDMATGLVKPGEKTAVWLQNGGMWAVEHFHGNSDLSFHVRDTVAEKVVNLPNLITVDKRDGGRFHVIHAELKYNKMLDDEALEDESVIDDMNQFLYPESAIHGVDGPFLQWGRKVFLHPCINLMTPREVGKFKRGAEINKLGWFLGPNLSTVYSGHSVVRNPTKFKSLINIDTGAFLSNRRSAVNGRLINPWAGLTFTEPATDIFYTVKADGICINEVQDLSI